MSRSDYLIKCAQVRACVTLSWLALITANPVRNSPTTSIPSRNVCTQPTFHSHSSSPLPLLQKVTDTIILQVFQYSCAMRTISHTQKKQTQKGLVVELWLTLDFKLWLNRELDTPSYSEMANFRHQVIANFRHQVMAQ